MRDIPWTVLETALAIELRNEGMSARRIAAGFPNRSRCSVIGRLHRLDVKPVRTGAPVTLVRSTRTLETYVWRAQ